MARVIIDDTRCIKCGRCTEECPCSILLLKDQMEIANPELCVSCGHCAAICPEGAIQCNREASGLHFSIQKIDNQLPPERQLFHLKRSVRAFKTDRINQETIEQLINYAEKAPSSHNSRKRKYIVITEPSNIRCIGEKMVTNYKKILTVLNPFLLKIISLSNKDKYNELLALTMSFKKMIAEFQKGNDTIFRKSGCIVCIAAPTGATHSKDDCLAAQHYLMLFGKTIGIESFIVGYAQYAHKVIEQHYNLEKGYSVFAVCALGFGKHTYTNEILYNEPEVIWK